MHPLDIIISDRLKHIYEKIARAAHKANRNPADIQIMAVTKTTDPAIVNLAIKHGITLLGENRVQEFLDKREQYALSSEQIHFIGHLQTNKVKYIIDKVSMIQSVSSFDLASEIDKRAGSIGKNMPVLIEVNIANEASKSGFSESEAFEAISRISTYQNMRIQGLMCIPSKDNAETCFDKMNKLFCELKARELPHVSMDYLSMGMSGDYEQAVLHNSNIVRLGTAIFGERNIGG